MRPVQTALRPGAVLAAVVCLGALGAGRAEAVPRVSVSVPARLMSAVTPARGETAERTQMRGHAAAVPCAEIFFLGARGSAEKATKQFNGMGPEVNAMASIVQDVLKTDGVTAKGSFRTLNVGYPADNVTDLIPTKYELALFAASPATGAEYYYRHNVEKYLSSISQGISDTVSEARYVHQQCPHALLVLAGYSQGAMVMHQAELQLQADGDSGLLGQIAGTLLLGDGDRVPHTQAREFGTSTAKSEGVRTWVHSLIGIGGHDVADPATTANICNAGDIVCATSLKVLIDTYDNGSGVKVHTSYVHGTYVDPALTSAADWMGQLTAARVLGSRWSAAAAPLPTGAMPGSEQFPYGDTVACPSASWCVAAGDDADRSGHPQGLLLMKQGKVWTAATAPLPAGAPKNSTVNLTSVACSSASWCVAVGVYQYGAGAGGGGLILTWSGNTWTATEAPLPPPDPGDQSRDGDLVSVACPSPSSCVAVGTYVDYDPTAGEGVGRGLLLTWSGTSWTATQPPLPAGAERGSARFTLLNADVACASASWCTAIGEYYGKSSTEQGLILTWSGNTWSAIKAPTPPGTNLSQGDIELDSVACPSASSCTVLGGYQDSSGRSYGLILTGASSAWTPTKTTESLFAVACPSVSSCIIGGDGVVLVGAGTNWKTINAPPAAAGTLLASVACPSTTPCAVAAQSPQNDGLQIVAGSGPNWTAFDVVPPGGINGQAVLTTIACPSPSTCVAVGDLSGASGGVVATGPS
jgi:Cutinase